MTKPAPTYHLGPDFDRKLTEFVDHFEREGYELFVSEFSKLDDFIAAAKVDQSDRTDKNLRQTPKIKYLLEAVSYRIYDRLNREKFNSAKHTMIILPDCLSIHEADCIKTDEEWGDRCQQCVDDCRANEVVDLAEQYGLEVVFSKRKLTEQIKHWAEQHDDLAVIGIGCLLMLAEGMRSAADADVPTRGVLLSFTGCDHWNDEPFASAFPIDQLKVILEEKYG